MCLADEFRMMGLYFVIISMCCMIWLKWFMFVMMILFFFLIVLCLWLGVFFNFICGVIICL